MSNQDSQTESSHLVELNEPKMYKVFLHNDDYTTMEFVVIILIEVFKKNAEDATDIMLSVHEKGTALCGIYPFEIAETKVNLVHKKARNASYPLLCTMEEEK